MILLDADVVLDVALDRAPHVEAAGVLLSHLEMQGPMAFVAWHTLANVADFRDSPIPAKTPAEILAELT